MRHSSMIIFMFIRMVITHTNICLSIYSSMAVIPIPMLIRSGFIFMNAQQAITTIHDGLMESLIPQT